MTAPILIIFAALVILNIAQTSFILFLIRKIAMTEMRERIG